VEGVDQDDHESPLARARNHGTRDALRRRQAEQRSLEQQEAENKMRQLDARSPAEVIGILQNRSENAERREAAAAILGGLKCRDGVETLIEALAEGQARLSWLCMSALIEIGSRRHGRRLIEIVRGNYPLPARQEAIYTLGHLGDKRAEQVFIQVAGSLDSEEEYTRDMATEALRNTWWRHSTQRALAERLFDPSVSVRYAALCACGMVDSHTLSCLRLALEAKLSDPAKVDDNRVIAELAAQALGCALH